MKEMGEGGLRAHTYILMKMALVSRGRFKMRGWEGGK